MRVLAGWMAAIAAVLLIAACQPQPIRVFIEVDGGRQSLTTEAATVREALEEAGISLEPLDRVRPDLYAKLEPGLVIVVTRVREEVKVTREVVPYERQTITNESLPAGETRLAQLGVNGEDEITTRIVYENGIEVSRTEVSRLPIIEPVPEILVVGLQTEIPSVPVGGTITYLDNGNAWLMRDSSGSRRQLTTEGNLDGRVFSLSPDGRHLIYTTPLSEEIGLPLNQMWLITTTIVGEKPITLSVSGALQAEWSPVVSQSLIAYTTAERTANSPGWQAYNDLWLLHPLSQTLKAVELLPPNTEGLYPWWGTNFSWSPDGRYLAYARADQIGLIAVTETKTISPTSLIDFVPLKTFSDWVWVPDLSWSPDGRFIAAVVHGPPLASEPPEESQLFDLWLISRDGKVSAKIAEQVGMWANPAWGPPGIAFGEAINPLQSVNSRYRIQLVDHDGSNKRQLFPFQEEPGVQFPELIWSPEGDQLLFIYNGNLYIANVPASPPRQLTIDGQVQSAQWTAYITPTIHISRSETISITQTPTLTPAPSLIRPVSPLTITPEGETIHPTISH